VTSTTTRSAPLGAVFCLLLASWPAQAQEVAEIPFWHQPEGSAGLGGGIRFGQSPYLAADNDDQRELDLVPLYLYEGKYLFARGVMGGVHIVNKDDYELNVFARYRFQKLDPDRNEFYDGLEERRQTVDAGIQFGISKAWGEVTMAWMADTLNRHNGQEVEVSYRYRFIAGSWSISPFISWSYQDADLTDYYFGVSADEATPERPQFSAGSSQWMSLGLNTAWHVSDRVVLFANVVFGGPDSDVMDNGPGVSTTATRRPATSSARSTRVISPRVSLPTRESAVSHWASCCMMGRASIFSASSQ
jgi:outer membrane scaffolding protein for murein synthesis (MipA/OmpV family)